jgi:hypothetical protein
MKILGVYNFQILHLFLAIMGYILTATVTAAIAVENSPLAIGLRTFTVFTAIGLLCLKFVRGINSNVSLTTIFYLSFWSLYVIKLFMVTLEAGITNSHMELKEYWTWAILICALPSMAVLTIKNPVVFDKLLKALVCSLAFSVVGVLLNGSFWAIDDVSGDSVYTGRFSLPALNPISIGHLGLTFLITMMWLSKSCKNIGPRFLVLVGGSLGVLLIILSASRGPLISGFIVCTFYVMSRSRFPIRKIFLYSLLITFVLLVFVKVHPQYLASMLLLFRIGIEDQSLSYREEAITGAIIQFLNNPIFGGGIVEEATGFYPHNVFIESFMALGLVGGLLLLALNLILLKNLWIQLKSGESRGWIGLLYLQQLVAVQFSGSIVKSPEYWIFVCLLIRYFIILNYSKK